MLSKNIQHFSVALGWYGMGWRVVVFHNDFTGKSRFFPGKLFQDGFE